MTGPSLTSQVASGAAWMILLKLVHRFLGAISMLILVRLLSPADFGLVAVATAVTALPGLFKQFGTDIALIRHENPTRDHYDTAWTMMFGISVIQAALIAGLAGTIATYFDDARLEAVLYVMAATFVLSGIRNIGIVDFRKHLQFGKEFRFQLIARVVGFGVTVPLAFLRGDYWALIFGTLGISVAELVLSYAMHEHRPRLNVTHAREMWNFSKWILANNMLVYMNTKFADLVIGKQVDFQSLGSYSVSREISNLFTSELKAPLNRAIFPGYSKLASDLKALAHGYLRVNGSFCLLLFPIGLGCAAVSGLLVPVVLGAQWGNAVPLIGILAVSGSVSTLTANTNGVLLALGKPDVFARLLVVKVCLYLLLLALGVKSDGVYGAALALLVANVLTTPLYIGVVRRSLELPWERYARNIYRPLTAGLAMLLITGWLTDYFLTTDAWAPVAELVVCVMVGVAIYAGTISLLVAGKNWTLSPEAEAVRMAKNLVRRRG